MKIPFFTIVTVLVLISTSCAEPHLINSEDYRALVDSSFEKTVKLAEKRNKDLFSVFEKDLSLEQIEAMKFLYAFMPLCDLAEFDGDFFLANVNRTLDARHDMPWGPYVPEEIFLHYVLPVRVNNENLDSFRIVCYDEIRNRIAGKSMKEAALEINHWCHEKVTYQPSDSRTSSPVYTILSARGRCGEESTFTVAALRAAGIPARQVYTPRWAHSDDNHAWVEFWADSTWYYMGACEPEPVADRGWFTEPARRAMLVHAKSFGPYRGNENILNNYEKYTEINNLSKYAVTKEIFVRALSPEHQPLKDAVIEYQLYNYAEFYPIATVPADKNGISSFETGLGDLLIWGRRGNSFGFKKISVAETDTVDLILENRFPGNKTINLDLAVPVKRSPYPGLSGEIVSSNNSRLEEENKIREFYIESWISRSDAVKLARELNLDTSETAEIIGRSMGNYKQIVTLLKQVPDSLRNLTVRLLKTVSDKDLRDTKASVFTDHIQNSFYPLQGKTDDPFFDNFILCPRISNEILSPWRSFFQTVLAPEIQTAALKDPSSVASLLDSVLVLADKENYSRTPLTPAGTWSLKVTDTRSRAICFVALCRSLGIASRLEPGRNIPQYFKNDEWHDVYFKDQTVPSPKKGYIKLTSSEKNPVPEYYIHFTLARFENGRYNTLEYSENTRINDFREELQLPPGNYMLVTGNRLDDSSILASLKFFTLDEGEHKNIEVQLRRSISPPEILGRADLSEIYSLTRNKDQTGKNISEYGSVVLWLEPEREPSKHVLNDFPLLREEFNSWPGSFVFLNVSGGDANEVISPEIRTGLPDRSFFGNDINLALLKNSFGDTLNQGTDFPLVMMIRGNGDILLRSEGYRIGIGEQILKLIK